MHIQMFLVTNVASLAKLIYMEEIDFRDIVTYLFMTRCNKLSLEHDLNCVYIGSVVMCCLLSTRVVFTVGEFHYSSYAFYHCSSVYSM